MAHFPVVLCGLNARYIHTNLALRDLQAYCLQHWPSAPVIRLAEMTINDQPLAIVRRLYRMNADLYAFSCYIWNIADVRRICRMLKKIRPDALIIWGGPEVSFDAEACLAAEPAVDGVIRGEGEAAFLKLLQCLFPADGKCKKQADLHDIAGLTWRDPRDGRIRSNPDAALLAADDWPFPYSREDLTQMRNRILYYETSRGCPFRCAYCLSALDRTVRHRSLPLVFAELDQLIDAGLQQVKLVDRTFNCLPERAMQIWRYLLDRRERIGQTNFHFEIAGDLLDDQAVDLLNAAPPGLFQLEIGVQTIQPDILRAINRTMNLDKLAQQVRRLRLAGRVHLHLDLIAGLPGETLEQFSQSLDWIWQLQPQMLQLGFLKILPGSPMRHMAVDRGYRWQDEPPYEVLQSDGMSFRDLSELKAVEQVIDLYANSGLFHNSLRWLAGKWPRPWQFLTGFAGWLDGQGALERSLGPEERSRYIWQFGRHAVPALNQPGWPADAWQDLLRLDYLSAGQKDQPAWLGFWENADDPADRDAYRRQKQVMKDHFPESRRFRLERYRIDYAHLLACGEVRPALWQICWDLSGNLPSLLDSRPVGTI